MRAKISSQEKRRVKLCDVYSDSSVETDTDVSSDSSRCIEKLSMSICSAALSFVCFLRRANLSFVSFFVFPILPEQLQEKSSYRKIFSLVLKRIAQHKGFSVGDSRVKFTTSLSGGKLRAHLLTSGLRTQLKAFVGGVCWQSKSFSQRSLFSGINVFAWSRICSIAPKFGQ